MITLDKKIQDGINALTNEELEYEGNYAFGRILCYGIDALVHNYLLRDIKRRILSLNEPLERIAKEYCIRCDTKHGTVSLPIQSIQDKRIFIPYAKGQSVWLFSPDYMNNFQHDYEGTEKRRMFDNANELTRRKWKVEDLGNQELLDKGIQFSEDLWKNVNKTFEKYQAGIPSNPLFRKLVDAIVFLRSNDYRALDWAKNKFDYSPKQSRKITQLGRELIKYYDGIIHG